MHDKKHMSCANTSIITWKLIMMLWLFSHSEGTTKIEIITNNETLAACSAFKNIITTIEALCVLYFVAINWVCFPNRCD